MILGFLCVLPTKRGVWTVPGYMSMYVYLLHPLVLFNPLVMHFAFEWMTKARGTHCIARAACDHLNGT